MYSSEYIFNIPDINSIIMNYKREIEDTWEYKVERATRGNERDYNDVVKEIEKTIKKFHLHKVKVGITQIHMIDYYYYSIWINFDNSDYENIREKINIWSRNYRL